MTSRDGLSFVDAVLDESGQVDVTVWNAFARAGYSVARCERCGRGAVGDPITESRSRGHVVRHATAQCLTCGKAAVKLIRRGALVPA